MYQFNTVIGTQTEKPKEIDTESSKYVVYIRTDIEPYEIKEEDSEDVVKGWRYKECAVPNNKYIIDKLQAQEEANDAILLGIAEMWEDKQNGGV